jgi:DNA-binding GntR family transcriptional regulator
MAQSWRVHYGLSMNTMNSIAPRTQQERVYMQLRDAILSGQFVPGRSVTLRGVAEMLGVSPMPVREALRRLTAERALELLGNRRIAVPLMTLPKLEEICEARVALETAVAERALPAISRQGMKELRSLDNGVTRSIAAHDVQGYIKGNYDFHFTLYHYGESQVTIPLIESLWLQTAPFMRLVLDRYGLQDLPDRHQQALDAIERGSASGLRRAIELDIREGPGGIGQAELDTVYKEALEM